MFEKKPVSVSLSVPSTTPTTVAPPAQTSTLTPPVTPTPPVTSTPVVTSTPASPESAVSASPSAEVTQATESETSATTPSTRPVSSIAPPFVGVSTYNLTAASLLEHLTSPDAVSVYLGADDAMQKVEWQRDGARDILVRKDIGTYLSDTAQDVAPTRNEATLSMVGKISEDKYNLTATGEWWPNSKYASKPIESTKATGMLEAATIGDVGSLFDPAVANLESIQASAPQVRTTRKGLFEGQGAGGPRIRLSHPLYRELPRTRSILNREFEEMRNWPVSAKQRPLFDDLCDRRTHMVQPLPAYDIDRKLIDPCLYERELRGAVVEVHFTLEHFRFAKDSTFVATIQEIIVHRMPVRILATPSRKRSYSIKPSDSPSFASGSPVKKLRLTAPVGATHQ